METAELNRWVEERTALLAPPPDFKPDVRPALARLHARIESTPPRAAWRWMPRHPAWPWMPWVATVAGFAALILALILLPGARALAQQLWQRLLVRRVEVVRLNTSASHIEGSSLVAKSLIPIAPPQEARDVDAARLRVGFQPRLPGRGVLPGIPSLTTLGTMAFGTVLKLADLERALAHAGITDQPVSPTWDNASLSVVIGPSVTASWPDITLMQSLPVVLNAPSGLDLRAYAVAYGRALGLPKPEAELLANRMVTAPAFLLPVEMEDRMILREVQLRTGPATLLIDLDDNDKQERLTLIWGVSDRLYVLSASITESLAIAIANSVE